MKLLKVKDKEFDAVIEERLADFDGEETQNMMRDWLSSPNGKAMLAKRYLDGQGP